jgi:hypothetical protein
MLLMRLQQLLSLAAAAAVAAAAFIYLSDNARSQHCEYCATQPRNTSD